MAQNHYLEHKDVSFEIKDVGDNGTFTGYASVYGNVDQGGDIVAPGAFTKSLEKIRSGGMKPKMLWQHDSSKVIGVWDTFSEDSTGLIGQGRVIKEVQLGREAHALLAAKALDGLSIGYRTVEAEFEENGRGEVRVIKEAELWEVSVVTFPMNTLATVTDVKQLEHVGEVERILRDAGVPNKFAKMVAAYGYPEAIKRLSGDQRDADDDETRAQEFMSLLTQLQGLKEKINA